MTSASTGIILEIRGTKGTRVQVSRFVVSDARKPQAGMSRAVGESNRARSLIVAKPIQVPLSDHVTRIHPRYVVFALCEYQTIPEGEG